MHLRSQQNKYWSQIVLLSAVALLLGALAIGCGDDEDDNPVDPPVPTVNLAGSWGTGYNSGSGSEYSCFTCYPDGYLIMWMADDPSDPLDEGGGVEIGRYTYNSSTKKMTFDCILDENGQHGCANDCVSFMADYTVEVVGDTFRSYENGSLAATGVRVKSATNPIVGGWGIGFYADHFPQYYSITFYANGIYILWRSDDPTASCDAAGVEIGTYTYTAASDELVINSVIRDDNGCGGFAVDGAEENPGDWTIRVVIDGDQLTAYEDGTTVSFTGPRVQ